MVEIIHCLHFQILGVIEKITGKLFLIENKLDIFELSTAFVGLAELTDKFEPVVQEIADLGFVL